MEWTQAKYEKNYVNLQKQKSSKKSSIPNMQRILNAEYQEFQKQELKRKIRFHGVKKIEEKIRLY